MLEQARGDERPVIDLPDDLLLAGVVLHDMLAARVGPGRGLALGGGVPVAFAGVAPQPVPEDPVFDQLGEQSVGKPASCWDNIVAESFFATLKKERV